MTAIVPTMRAEWAPDKKATEIPSGGDWEVFSEEGAASVATGRMQSCTIKRGQQKLRGNVATGTADMGCTNLDRLADPYDPDFNPTSKLKEGRQFRLFAVFDGVDYQRFQGFLEIIDPDYPVMGYVSTIRLVVADIFSLLAENELEDEDFEEQVEGERIEALLAAAGIVAGRMDIDPGKSYLTAVELRGRPVLDELRQIAHDSAGRVFASPDGKVQFLDRHRQIDPLRDYFDIKATFGADRYGVSTPRFLGIGASGLTVTGTYTGLPTTNYTVQIDGSNTFRWSLDGGDTWEATGVAFTPGSSSHTLDQGLSIEFAAGTYVEADFWEFSAGEIPYYLIKSTVSKVRNRIQVRGASGALQQADNTASQDEYNLKTFTVRASQLRDDRAARDYAYFLLNESDEPHKQYSKLGVRPFVDDDLALACWPQILSLRPGDKVRVVERPKQEAGTVTESICIIEGITDEWKHPVWESTEFLLSPALTKTYWILEHPIYGRLDFTTRPAF